MRESREKIPMYALRHKKKKMQGVAKMMGYSLSALLNLAFDEFYEKKKGEFSDWLKNDDFGKRHDFDSYSLREKIMIWYYKLTIKEKDLLKRKYYEKIDVYQNDKFEYDFSDNQIKEMYKMEFNEKDEFADWLRKDNS
jgi:hypothetical protein